MYKFGVSLRLCSSLRREIIADFTLLVYLWAEKSLYTNGMGGVVALWLVRWSGSPGSSPDQGTALCSWTRHLILMVPLSTQLYKWVPKKQKKCWGNPALDKHPIQGGVEIPLVALCYRNRDKLQPAGPLGSNADLAIWKLQNLQVGKGRIQMR